MWRLWATCPWRPTGSNTEPGLLPQRVRLEATAPRGQTVCMAFGMRAPVRLEGVTVLAENLERRPQDRPKEAVPFALSEPARSEVDGATDVIGPDRIDVRIVATEPGGAMGIPLLKRDGGVSAPDDGVPPTVPSTTVEPSVNRFFWVTVNVPPDVTPGPYRGRVYVDVAGRRGRYLEIALDVMPRVLPAGPAVHGMFYTRPYRAEDRAVLAAELRDLRAHGVNAASAADGAGGLLQAIELRYLMGLRRAVPVTTPLDANAAQRITQVTTSRGWPPLWMTLADPGALPPAGRLARLDRVRGAGARLAVVCSGDEAAGLSTRVDVLVYRLTPGEWRTPQRRSPAPADRAGATGSGRRPGGTPLELYTWNCAAVEPVVNRLLAGMVLFLSGMDGVMPSGYLGPGTGTTAHAGGVVLASRHGPTPTVRWEAFREGVYDYRCLVALQQAVRDASDVPACHDAVAAAQTFLADLRARVGPDLHNALTAVSSDDTDGIRAKALQLWNAIEARRAPAARGCPDRGPAVCCADPADGLDR